MAELLTFAAEGTVTRLASLAEQEFSLLWGFKRELTSLRESLSMIQAILRDAGQQQGQGEAVGQWVKKLEDIADDADDVLDEYEYEVHRRKGELQDQMKKKVLDFFSHNNAIAFRFKMAHKIKNINASLANLMNKASSIGLVATRSTIEGAGPHDRMGGRETVPRFVKDEKYIVGREEVVSDIVTTLINSSSNPNNDLSVMAIVGMGGLGKTTLAKSIYHDKKIESHFHKKIWVCVSTRFELTSILGAILEYLKPEMAAMKREAAIDKNLQEVLKGQRYLLVLDDVWNEDPGKWDHLRDSLVDIKDTQGSTIIVTSRSVNVASIVQTLPRYDLEKLSDDQCWLVLKDRALPNGNASLTEDQERIGKEIAKRCGGLPLLAKVLGSTMLSKGPDGWRKILESRIWDLPEGEKKVLSILKLSFDELKPPSLKQCFANCSTLRKGSEIEKDDLIQLWMAHGLLHPPPRMSNQEMEDIGDEYFNILWQNSFLQDVTKDEDGISCRMHDLVHDLAEHVSKSNVEDSNKTRHWAIPVLEEIARRSVGEVLGSTISPRFKGLRVLNLSGADWVEELPISIGKLKHLRYLNVPRTGIRRLPISIGKLYNLQTLRTDYPIEEFPTELKHLISLRHFYFNSEIEKYPVGIGRLTNLRSLLSFSVGKGKGRGIEELAGLKYLKGKLSIENLENVRDGDEAKKAKLAEKTSIRHLSFIWVYRSSSSDIKNDEEVGVLEGLQPPHLNLESLKILNFMGDKFPSWMMSSCFPALKRLTIDSAKKVTEWTEGAAAASGVLSKVTSTPLTAGLPFPSLCKLEISRCWELSSLPSWVQRCTSLQRLSIQFCDKLASFPTLHGFASLRELEISGCDALKSLLNIGIESCTSLESLTICKCQNLETAVPSLDNLTKLRQLEIVNCLLLKTLPDGFTVASPNMMVLRIGGFWEELESFPAFQVLELKTLILQGWPKLKFLPEQVQHLTSLTSLTIKFFDGMEALPEWLGSLASLENLDISWCRNMMHLPKAEAMESLTKLKKIVILDCPLLKERCNKDNGPEWHKISHIPEISCY